MNQNYNLLHIGHRHASARRAGPCLTALIAAGLLLAGCGGTSPAQPTAKPHSSASPTSFGAQFVAYASCMRSHGVPGYPDPKVTSSGNQVHVQISPGNANTNGPAFKSADAACHRLLPNGGAPAGGTSAKEKAQELKFADCMRAHGVPDFPDASKDGGFDLPPGLNPEAPSFVSAEHVCHSVEPSSLAINQSG